MHSLLALAILLFLPTLVSGAECWSVQVASVDSQAQAVAVVERLQTRGIRSVMSTADGRAFRVLVGRGRVYMDAYLLKEDLNHLGVDGFVVKGTPESCSDAEAAVLLRRLFGLRTGELYREHQRSLAGNSTYEMLEKLDFSGNEASYKAALLSHAEGLDVRDSLYGYVLANLGNLALKEGDYTTASQHYWRVAAGEVASAANHRLMAMRRYAWIQHQIYARRTEAYRAYTEILDQTNDPSVRTTCEVEIAGLLMELAESGKGTHNEARAAMEEFRGRVPAERVSAAATLELMHLETWVRQPHPDYLKAAHLAEAFIVRWSKVEGIKPMREINGAKFMTGLFYQLSGDHDNALKWYSKTLEEVSEDDPIFKGVPPKSAALLGLSNMANESGDKELWQQICEEIIRTYPDSIAAERIGRSFPEMSARVRESMEKRNGEVEKR
jgi:tetratricopeptide (TPR) repeat protein